MTQKANDFLRRVGEDVRDYIKNEWLPKSDLQCTKSLSGLCAHASVILYKRLKQLGKQPKIVEAADGAHYFVLCDNALIDITASQFGQPKICVRDYAEVKKTIKAGEINWWFWKETKKLNCSSGYMKSVANEVYHVMRKKA